MSYEPRCPECPHLLTRHGGWHKGKRGELRPPRCFECDCSYDWYTKHPLAYAMFADREQVIAKVNGWLREAIEA